MASLVLLVLLAGNMFKNNMDVLAGLVGMAGVFDSGPFLKHIQTGSK